MLANAESYLCVGDEAAGFVYNKKSKEWKSATFFADKKKWIISKEDENSTSWKVTEAGEKVSLIKCVGGFNEIGNLICSGWANFRFSKNNMRFIYVNQTGFWNVGQFEGNLGKEGSDYPVMIIGRCNVI